MQLKTSITGYGSTFKLWTESTGANFVLFYLEFRGLSKKSFFFGLGKVFSKKYHSFFMRLIPRSGYSFVERHYGYKNFPVGDRHLERNTS